MKPFSFKRSGQEFGFTPLIGMTEEEVLKLVPEYVREGKVPEIPTWTIAQVSKAFLITELRSYSKELGLKTTGLEAELAAALIAAGFDFTKRKGNTNEKIN